MADDEKVPISPLVENEAMQSWMENKFDNNVKRNIPIWKMSIPGTHESCSRFGKWSKCQHDDMTITKQLNSGIRFFDFRFYYNNEKGHGFDIWHGKDFQHATFKKSAEGLLDQKGRKKNENDVRNINYELIDWIKKHPKEIIFANIPNQGHTKNETFSEEFHDTIKPDSKYWFFFSVNRDKKDILTYNNLKGKIVLIRSYNEFTKSGWSEDNGIPWNGYNDGSMTFNYWFITQNVWEGCSESEKKKYISTLCDIVQSIQTKPDTKFQLCYNKGKTQWNHEIKLLPERICINFISRGCKFLISDPGDYANIFNPYFYDIIKKVDNKYYLGFIAQDFPKQEHIQTIINHN
eukprot:279454_1